MVTRGTLLLVCTLAVGLPLAPGVAAGPDQPEERLLALVNEARLARRLEPLVRQPWLDEVARANSRRMVRARRMRHSDAAALRRLPVVAAAENVGYGPDVETIHRLLMKSARHRANTLGRYESVGIAVERGRDRRLYATLVFGATRRPSR